MLVQNKSIPALMFSLIIAFSQFAYSQTLSSKEDNTSKSPWHRSMTAVRIENSPKVDGKLDDPVWQTVEFEGDFLQREPNEGKPATEITEIAVIYDSKNLYVGARCFDSEPDKIVGTEMRRDVSPGRDDYFDVILDTFHDRRSAFFFTTTPAGGRLDGSISEDGKIDNRDWDGIWRSKTSRDDKGWYVEIAIPWQTLRFHEGDELVWGAQFVRRIIRKNEEDFWRLVPLYAGHLGQNRISEEGDLYGLKGLKMGGKFEFKPYVIGGLQKDSETDFQTDKLADIGGSMKWNMTASMTADFTYNTDFAQVEADQEQVNLTRFSLFFPEKRDFFLEGAGTFAFGGEGVNPYRARAGNIQLFYSRRIGISDGQRVPIIGGMRLNGKVGEKTSIGVLSIQTREKEFDDGSGSVIPQTNYSVVRLKRNVFSRSSIGGMFLNKQEVDGSFNRSFGFDTNFNLSDKFTFYMNGAGTYSPETTGIPSRNRNNFAGNAGFSYRSDLWQYSGSFLDIENHFNPEMGFVLRTDIKKTNASLTYSPRPKKWASIRKFNYTTRGYYQTDGHNLMLNRGVTGEFGINFQSSAYLRASVSHDSDFIGYDWNVRNGLLIPMNIYENTSAWFNIGSSRAKRYGWSVNMNGGDYFTGTKIGGGFGANLQALGRIVANVNYGYNNIELPDVSFHTNRFSGRISYSFNPDLYIKAFLQWYDDALLNDGKDRFSGNIILRYTYIPGSDIYIVFNQERLMGPGMDFDTNKTFIAKLTYFFRK